MAWLYAVILNLIVQVLMPADTPFELGLTGFLPNFHVSDQDAFNPFSEESSPRACYNDKPINTEEHHQLSMRNDDSTSTNDETLAIWTPSSATRTSQKPTPWDMNNTDFKNC